MNYKSVQKSYISSKKMCAYLLAFALNPMEIIFFCEHSN